jgi:hypothetical protein
MCECDSVRLGRKGRVFLASILPASRPRAASLMVVRRMLRAPAPSMPVYKNYLARCPSHTMHIGCLTFLSNVVAYVCRLSSKRIDRWPLPDNWLPKRRSIGTREQSIVTSTVSYPSDSRRRVLRCFTGQTAFFGRYGARKFDPPPSAPPGRANKQAAERAETSNPWEQGSFR